MVEDVDQVALAMERKWGIDRLRLLVPVELRARFDAQKDRLDQAIASNLEDHVRVQAQGMVRAWEAVDRAAVDAGNSPLCPEVWELQVAGHGRGRVAGSHRGGGAPSSWRKVVCSPSRRLLR